MLSSSVPLRGVSRSAARIASVVAVITVFSLSTLSLTTSSMVYSPASGPESMMSVCPASGNALSMAWKSMRELVGTETLLEPAIVLRPAGLPKTPISSKVLPPVSRKGICSFTSTMSPSWISSSKTPGRAGSVSSTTVW